MLGDCGKTPYGLVHDGYTGLGWIVDFTLYDEDEYTYDDGRSHVWLDKASFDDFVSDPTTDGIDEILIEHAKTRYRENYIVELYPTEVRFADGNWDVEYAAAPMNYIYRRGEWEKFPS